MERRELLRRLVLDCIRDDFENVDQIIFPEVTREGTRFGLTIDRSDVVDALRSVVEDGFAKAYQLHTLIDGDPFSGELPGMPSLEVVEEDFETYFYITEKGREYHLADSSWWPFDDEDDARP